MDDSPSDGTTAVSPRNRARRRADDYAEDKKKLLAQGYDELVAASAPAPASVPPTGEEGTGDKAAAKKIAAKTDAWKEYGEAYK